MKTKLLYILFYTIIPIISFSQIIVNNGSDIVFNGTSSFVINGTDFETLSDGTIHDNNTANVYFTGNSNTEILGTALALQNITINNSANVTLQTPLTIGTNLTFSNGDIISSTNKELKFALNSISTNPSANSHAVGIIQKSLDAIDNQFDFPLGNGTLYAPIGISGLAGAETYTAQYFYSSPHDAGFDSTKRDTGLKQISKAEYWLLNRAGSENAYVTLYWNSSHSGGISNASELLLCHWNSAIPIWEIKSATISGNSINGSITSDAKITSFSPFTLGSTTDNNNLPIKLSKFNAIQQNESIHINWTTESEQNNDEFILEKSIDGIHFYPIANLSGAGTSTTTQNYSEFDLEPSSLNYYRLIQVDFDGTKTYSKTISIITKTYDRTSLSFENKNIYAKNLISNNIYNITISNETGSIINKIDLLANSPTEKIPYVFSNGVWIVSIYRNQILLDTKKIIFN